MALLESKYLGERIPTINIYALFLYSAKVKFWDSLDELKSKDLHENFVLGGDFNTILSAAEKRGVSIVRDPFRDCMNDLIVDWDLYNVISKTGKFSWSNHRSGDNHIAARLGKFLLHNSWIMEGLECLSAIKAQGDFDHQPIMLQLEKPKNLGLVPFSFNFAWIQEDGVVDLIMQAWNSIVQGSSTYFWESKTQNVKKALRKWLKESFQPLG